MHHVHPILSALPAVQGLISLTTSPVIAAGIAGLATSATAHSAVEVCPGLLPSPLFCLFSLMTFVSVLLLCRGRNMRDLSGVAPSCSTQHDVC